MANKTYQKTIDEKYIVPERKGGGIIKFEAWQLDGVVVKYNMVYINKSVFAQDNGRVVGYDNAHDFHHRHYLGEIVEIEDFVSYHDQVLRFRDDIKEFIDD